MTAEMVCEPDSRPGVEAGELRADPGRSEAQHADDDGEKDLRQTVALQPAEKLRPDAIAERKQEHQEEHRLHVRRDVDVHLSHQHAHEQRAGDCPQAEVAEFDAADPISHAERKENGEFRVMPEESCDGVDDRPPLAGQLFRCCLNARGDEMRLWCTCGRVV